MKQTKLDDILQIVAEMHHTTVEDVSEEIQLMLNEAQNTQDPQARILWASIPRKGDTLTLEEFLHYLSNIYSPPEPLPDSPLHIPS